MMSKISMILLLLVLMESIFAAVDRTSVKNCQSCFSKGYTWCPESDEYIVGDCYRELDL